MISRLLFSKTIPSKFTHINRCLFSVQSFTELEQLNDYLHKKKAIHSIVYFRSNWNPQCQETDKHVEQLSRNTSELEVIKINTDNHRAKKIANHYSIKCEPQFVLCLYGDEFTRQIGSNLPALKKKLQKMVKIGAQTDLSDMPQKWVPYGTEFLQYYDQFLQHRLDWNK